MQVKTYWSVSNFYLEKRSGCVEESLVGILRDCVTDPDIRELLFNLPGKRHFMLSANDCYVEAFDKLYNFTDDGKCIVDIGNSSSIDLFDLEQEVLIGDPYSAAPPVLGVVPQCYGVVEFNFAHDPDATRSFLGEAVAQGFAEDPTALLK